MWCDRNHTDKRRLGSKKHQHARRDLACRTQDASETDHAAPRNCSARPPVRRRGNGAEHSIGARAVFCALPANPGRLRTGGLRAGRRPRRRRFVRGLHPSAHAGSTTTPARRDATAQDRPAAHCRVPGEESGFWRGAASRGMGAAAGTTGRTATGSAAYGASLRRDCTIAAARTALTARSSGSVRQ
jgi:hypothetical protein